MKIRTWFAMGVGAAIGGGAVYLLDPEHGSRRRKEVSARLKERARDEFADQARMLLDQARGGFHEAIAAVRPADVPNDSTLQRKVESEALGPSAVPSGSVSVEAADGVITLRGEVGTSHQIEELVAAVSGVAGVRRVDNRLTLGTAAATT